MTDWQVQKSLKKLKKALDKPQKLWYDNRAPYERMHNGILKIEQCKEYKTLDNSVHSAKDGQSFKKSDKTKKRTNK